MGMRALVAVVVGGDSALPLPSLSFSLSPLPVAVSFGLPHTLPAAIPVLVLGVGAGAVGAGIMPLPFTLTLALTLGPVLMLMPLVAAEGRVSEGCHSEPAERPLTEADTDTGAAALVGDCVGGLLAAASPFVLLSPRPRVVVVVVGAGCGLLVGER